MSPPSADVSQPNLVAQGLHHCVQVAPVPAVANCAALEFPSQATP